MTYQSTRSPRCSDFRNSPSTRAYERGAASWKSPCGAWPRRTEHVGVLERPQVHMGPQVAHRRRARRNPERGPLHADGRGAGGAPVEGSRAERRGGQPATIHGHLLELVEELPDLAGFPRLAAVILTRR